MNSLRRNTDTPIHHNDLLTEADLQNAEKYKTKNSQIEKIVDLASCCITTPCLPCFLALRNLNRAFYGSLVFCSGACATVTCCAPVTCLACFCDEEDTCCEAVKCCVDQTNKSCGISRFDDSALKNDVPYEAQTPLDNCAYAACSGHFWAKRGICTEPLPIKANGFLTPYERHFVEKVQRLREPTDRAYSSIFHALNTPSSAPINDPTVTLTIAQYLNPTLADQMWMLQNYPQGQQMK